jgi:primosomal protein N' (replication factor Y)
MPYVEVAVNSGLPHGGSFSYAVPDGMTLGVGDAVLVPFGRRTLQGIVVATSDVPAVADPRPVEARIGETPLVSGERIELARWVAGYYLAPLFDAVALMLPPGYEQRPLTTYRSLLSAAEVDTARLPPRQRAVLEWLIMNGPTEAAVIKRDADLAGLDTALAQLTQRGFVERSFGLSRPSVRTKTVRYVELTTPDAATQADSLAASRQKRLAAVLRLLAAEGPRLPASDVRQRTGVSVPGLAPLIDAGLVAIRDEAVARDPLAGRSFPQRPAAALTPSQDGALAPIAAALTERRHETFLLHGVTGSGKTEVYLDALACTLALGRRAIVLVPEIALTPQTVRRFAERFAGQVAVIHSGLSQGELHDQWHGIQAGRYAVVVGSRSALFAPQPDLGLIVIDEEHEWTYKQEQTPRYHARETAEQLARLCDAVLVLGSATPDVTSYQHALSGRYRLLELPERVRPVLGPSGAAIGIEASMEMPPVDVVDMREELKSGNRGIFSRALQFALYETLERDEQAILFLNRRGIAGFLQCRDCGFVPQCPACAIAFSYHRRPGADRGDSERLVCHQCNRTHRVFETCPMCGSNRLRPMGLGVERVEEEIAALFPEARSVRWDRDVTRGRNAHEAILARFVAGEADILIGTQMVAKGLDLPAVTLVGAISADIGLHIPDFRSAERTFQLLTQVAGRAGRARSHNGGSAGQVVVQTYTPESYAIVAAAQHDYAQFFATEIGFRREAAYPPFIRLARLVYANANYEKGQRMAAELAETLRREAARRGLPSVQVDGPAPPHVPKWHGQFRWQVTLRAPDPAELLRDSLGAAGETPRRFGNLSLATGWSVDIDPVSLA